MMKERFYSQKKYGDFLDVVSEEMKKDEPLFNVESAAYFVFTVLFASFEMVSLAITLAIKFILEYPSVLKDLGDEHEEILRNRENVDSPLTWNEYKSMAFTSHTTAILDIRSICCLLPHLCTHGIILFKHHLMVAQIWGRINKKLFQAGINIRCPQVQKDVSNCFRHHASV
ncbi:hypothetical protein IFM89_015401 [Coptis chinensis]|uniref:Cytochrome P450 n=1 Tax=Coptis chinensis TaxID=261450 RepID=A0A835MCR3_9MAGN|nr:hypothetical protein IFM89_015401 [Coptis chinensis]